ncbi:clathrin light chain-domain-containing protein [Blyttiomyces helicus]|uniref:Clathrin light chain n=1 Tax=Blyttiomyces helicus TaxID=388810 RepID=A0A4P9WG74_9FUNG|nr:clathrin light chain-domain-containing protein [Blyttiomyces helicus]|eukprot:RKO90348.1 clathrin light chain-domain-containing protein [Blyttiomyces helicus]
MSDFGDFSATPAAPTAAADFFASSDDPTADFLAREQAVLGAEAALFGNEAALSAASSAPVGGGDADFGAAFGGSGGPAFASPAFASPAAPLPFEHTGASSVGSFASSPVTPHKEPEVEPDVIRAWREDFNATIADRDAKSKKKHAETLQSAKEALERFYAEYNDKKAKSINRNKEQEKALIASRDDTTSGNVWDRVVKQIELSSQLSSASSSGVGKVNLGKTKPTDDKGKDAKAAKPQTKVKDTQRMKQLLLSLKKDPKAPGVEIAA